MPPSIFPARSLYVAYFLMLTPCLAEAQRLTGAFEFSQHPTEVLLLDTRGGDHMVIDSSRVDRKGRFTFSQQRYPPGFYQLAINDTDRVDIILDPRENDVRFTFTGTPLQEHITIEESVENQRMWEYKMISRQSQKRLAPLREQRAAAEQADKATHWRLDSLEARIRGEQQQGLINLIEQDTTSYFSHVVLADLRLSAAIPKGHLAIREAFDWTDGRLLRSSVFSRAIMAWMQTAPPELPDGMISASDSLLKWTAAEPEAWDHTRSLLIRLFDQYGPDFVSQYLVDRYVAGPDALVPPDDVLMMLLTEQLKVSVGAQAPEVILPLPGSADTLVLYDILEKNKFTALFFYSSTCDHCHEQIPGLNRMYDEWKDRGLAIVGIALDGDKEEFEQTLEEEQVNWPAYSELMGWGSPAAKAFLVKATPTFFLLDEKGTIVSKPYDQLELRAHLERLMN